MSERIPSGYVEAWVQFNLSGDMEAMYVSIGAKLSGPTFANQTDTDLLLTIMRDRFKVLCVSAYTVGPGHVLWGQTVGTLRFDGTITPAAGTAGVDACPQNTAVLVRKTTFAGGRRGRGRMYVPGVHPGSVSDNGIIAGASVTSYNTAMAGVLSDVAALANFDYCVLFHETAPFEPSEITSLKVQTVVATQRRRLRR